MDFSALSDLTEIKSVISQSIKHIRSQPLASVLALTNIKDMRFSNEVKDEFNSFMKGNKPHIKASAVVGLSGLQQIVYNGLMRITGRDIKSFNTLNEAKDWLVSKY
jgi:hypothetical protein